MRSLGQMSATKFNFVISLILIFTYYAKANSVAFVKMEDIAENVEKIQSLLDRIPKSSYNDSSLYKCKLPKSEFRPV